MENHVQRGQLFVIKKLSQPSRRDEIELACIGPTIQSIAMMCCKSNTVLACKRLSSTQNFIVQVEYVETYSGRHASRCAKPIARSHEITRNATRNTEHVQACLVSRPFPKKLEKLVPSHKEAASKGLYRWHPQDPLI